MVFCFNAVVNIMTMNLGPAATTGMGNLCVQTAQSAISNLKQLSPNSKLGVTPMIGFNDQSTEIFQLSDAQVIIDFAKSNSDVAYLAFWSLNRDNGNGPPGETSPSSSGFIRLIRHHAR